MENLIYIVSGSVLLLQAFQYFIIFRPFFSRQQPLLQPDIPVPVSVIICARNAENLLRINLPDILDQDYPEFEVVVVDDCSTDNTATLLQSLTATYSHLQPVYLESKTSAGKKDALTAGIRVARYNSMLLTDADCFPAGNSWISAMMSSYTPRKEIVLGYGPYLKRPGLLNKLIRFDAAWIAIQYLGMGFHNKPYMAVGRNLSYTKDIFLRHEGFEKHKDVISGDDDLFIRDAATRANTTVCIHRPAFTYSQPHDNLRAWLIQKARHASTSSHYRMQSLSVIWWIALTNMAIYMLIALQFGLELYLTGLCFLLIKWMLTWYYYHKGFQKLYEKDLVKYVPLLDLIYIFVLPIPGIVNLFTGNKRWN